MYTPDILRHFKQPQMQLSMAKKTPTKQNPKPCIGADWTGLKECSPACNVQDPSMFLLDCQSWEGHRVKIKRFNGLVTAF